MRVAAATRGTGDRLLALFAAISMILSLMVVYAIPADANAPNDHQVKVCHATGSETNPYVATYPAKHQAAGPTEPNGHGEHADDIIPPFEAGTQGDHSWDAYSGKNWDAEGQAIWNNDCEAREEEPEPEPLRAAATVGGLCVEGAFVVRVDTVSSTVAVDLDGDGTIEVSESGLTTGRHAVTAAVGASIRFEATADVGARFPGAAPSGRILVLDCVEEVEPLPAAATVEGLCVEGAFVVRVDAVNSIVAVDLDGDGTIEVSESGLTTGLHTVTAAVDVSIRFEATADVGARFHGAVPSGRILVLDCVEEEPEPETGTLQVKKEATDDTELEFTFTGPDGTFTLKHGESFFFEAELGVEYTFTEILPEGWRLEEIDCDDPDGTAVIDLENNSVTMVVTDPGSPFKCNFDNEEGVFDQVETGTLQVKKEATDDTELEFTFTGPDGTFTLKHGESFFFEAELGVEYTFTEILPEGWRLEEIDCDDPDGTAVIDLENNSVTMVVTDPGSPFKCNFDNEEGVFDQVETGTLQVKKHATDDREMEFTFTGPDGEFTLSDNESFFFEAELGVEYTFTEIVPEGWFLEDIECDDPDGTAVIDLENNSVTMVVTNSGSPFKCDFDNEEEAPQEVEAGRIVIEKLVNEGSDQETEFTFVPVGFSMGDDTLAHGEDDSTAVVPGDYAVSEVIPEGWELVSAVCDSTDEADESTPADIDISADEVVTCTFTNGEVEVAEEVLPQIAVTKTADTETAAPGDTVTFTVVISNPSASEPVRISSIIDSVFGTLAGDTDCTVDVTLAPGASCEFTFTWMVTDQDLGTHENIVEVIGADVERPDVTVRASDNVVISVDEVAGIVITPDVPTGPVTPIVPDVAADVVADVTVEAEQLPFTGIESDRLIGLAIMLLGGGVLLLRWAPRPEEG